MVRSHAFWGWFLGSLGYVPYQEWPDGRSYRLGSTYIVLVQVAEDRKATGFNRKNIGLNHLAFHAGSVADVDNMTRALQERGVQILYADKHPHAGGRGTHAVYFEDPDRIKVEFVFSEDAGGL